MAQVINTNVGALFAGAALNKSSNALQTAQTRLSSGLRINSAKDDATGLQIATGYDSKIRGTNMAVRNANDGISQLQTNDGNLAQVTENLQRMREIAVQNGGTVPLTGTNGFAESEALAKENTRLVGLNTTLTAVVNDADGGTYTPTSAAVTLAGAGAASYADVGALDTEIGVVTTARADIGADMVALGSAVSSLQTQSVNISASFSRVMDTDYAAEAANMTRNNILQQAGTAVLSQANQTPNSVLGLLR